MANAKAHVGSSFLLRMDFEDFFGSIADADIRAYVRLNSIRFCDWAAEDVNLFCNLVCRNAVLPIGAPTSPMLSNALCYELDEKIALLAARHGVTYTRYADDLFFSTRQPNVLRQVEAAIPGICGALECPRNLRINTRKTRHSSKAGARRVTGITLGSDGQTYLGRSVKRRIRAMIFRLDALGEPEKASLRGWIAYASGVDPDFLNSLIAKYGLPRVRRAQRA